ncbi:MAG TPA: hypothetical protein VF702_06630 [Allosphingosinicella sp.]|jgi:hypothetical protein
MFWRLLALLIGAGAALGSVPARACSLAEDYLAPSNYELVQIADAIVIASAGPRYRNSGGGPNVGDGGVVFRVLGNVKGAPPARVRLDDATLGSVRRSDLTNLSDVHPDASRGMCNRYTFARGERYLLFLARGDDGSWGQLDFPFSRVNEDYAGEHSVWMRTVRRYLDLQRSLPPMEQIAALRRMADSGRDRDGSLLRGTERADIRAHLGWISPWKPTAYLLDLNARIERGEPLPTPARTAGPAGERLLILRSLAQGDHPEAMPLFERLSAAPETNGRLRGIVLRYLTRNGRYAHAYAWIETHLLDELPLLPRDDAMALLADVAEVQRGESWEAGEERWRSDPRAAATWPALARRIHRYQVATFGEEHALPFYDMAEVD